MGEQFWNFEFKKYNELRSSLIDVKQTIYVMLIN